MSQRNITYEYNSLEKTKITVGTQMGPPALPPIERLGQNGQFRTPLKKSR